MRPKFLKPNDYAPLFFIGAFFMALLAAGTLVLAQEPNQHTKESFCKSIIQIHDELNEEMKDIPHASKIIRGLAAQRFVKAFNEYGQQTNIQADSVGFYAIVTQPNHILVTFELNHCVKDKGMMPIKVYVELMRQSQNTDQGA